MGLVLFMGMNHNAENAKVQLLKHGNGSSLGESKDSKDLLVSAM